MLLMVKDGAHCHFLVRLRRNNAYSAHHTVPLLYRSFEVPPLPLRIDFRACEMTLPTFRMIFLANLLIILKKSASAHKFVLMRTSFFAHSLFRDAVMLPL